MSSTVEPRFNEGSVPNWQNLLAVERPIRYIEVFFHIFSYYWGKENRSLFQGLRYTEVRYRSTFHGNRWGCRSST